MIRKKKALESDPNNRPCLDRSRATRYRTRHVAAVLVGFASLTFSATAFSDTTASYTYDALGRLSKVTYNDAGVVTTISYSYDAAGNRTGVVSTSP